MRHGRVTAELCQRLGRMEPFVPLGHRARLALAIAGIARDPGIARDRKTWSHSVLSV
jgi:hypothetical protein